MIKHLYLRKWDGWKWVGGGGKTNHHLHPSPKNWGFWLVGFDEWSACFVVGRHKNYKVGPVSHQLYKWRLENPSKSPVVLTTANAHPFKASFIGVTKSHNSTCKLVTGLTLLGFDLLKSQSCLKIV